MTTWGRVISGAWSTWWLCVLACMRSAMNRWVSGLIMRSSSAMRNQVGMSFHPGFGTGFWMHPDGDGSLDRGEQGMFFGGGVVCEGIGKGVVRQPDPAAVVGPEFGRLRVWGIAVENVGDGLALVGGEGRDVDQGLNAWVAGGADYAAGVRVAGQDDGSFGPIDCPDHRVHVVVE